MVRRAYEEWPSANRFCCWGRVMCGPLSDIGSTCCVWTLIVLPSAMFFAYVAPQMWVASGPAYPLTVAYLFVCCAVLLALTSFTDPGVLPRTNAPDPPPDKRVRTVIVEGHTFELRWCTTCKVWKPPRASHCSSCDNCVLAFDHHCPFVGNCVGLRNYHYFLWFVSNRLFLTKTS